MWPHTCSTFVIMNVSLKTYLMECRTYHPLHSKEVMLYSKHTLACRQYTRTCFFLKDGQRSSRHDWIHLLTPRPKRCPFEASDWLKRRKPHNTQGEIFSSISREHKDQIAMALSRLKLLRAHLLGSLFQCILGHILRKNIHILLVFKEFHQI